jgi:hypothetical protein
MFEVDQWKRIAVLAVLTLGAACGGDDNQAAGDGQTQLPPSAAGAPAAPVGMSGATTPVTSPPGSAAPTATPSNPAPGNPAPTTPSSGAGGTPAPATPTAMLDPATPLKDLPAQCRGFEVRGLKSSPGGSTLPNTCAPFDGKLNNPYAIRCVDADPNYHTQFAGDEFCILPPPEELGTQVRVGPESYDNPGMFVLAAGDETTAFFNVDAPNATAHYYYRANWRMRPGGHHVLISLPPRDLTDGWTAGGDMGSEFGGSAKSFGGSQRPVVDRPQGTLDIPAENQGLGQQLPAHQQFSFNVHHINVSDVPILREVWVNVWYMDEKDVTAPMNTFAATGNPGDMAIPAGRAVKLEYKCAVAADTRLISMYGHYHAHNERFGAWLVRAGSERVSIYESFNWEDIPVYQFDTQSKNPAPALMGKTDGAFSGTLMVKAGDEIHFQCEINNDSNAALSFVNETFTGEMCILFAAYTGSNPCLRVQRAN